MYVLHKLSITILGVRRDTKQKDGVTRVWAVEGFPHSIEREHHMQKIKEFCIEIACYSYSGTFHDLVLQ